VEGIADDRRGKRVRDVVAPGHAQLVRSAEDIATLARREDELTAIVEVGASLRPEDQRETAHLGCRAGVKRDRRWIVEVQDGDVARTLPRDDVPLRRDVR